MMKRRLKIEFHRLANRPSYLFTDGVVNQTITIEGNFRVVEDKALQRFVDVQLLDAPGVSLNQKGMAWTYEDTLAEPLREGEYVLVPFGWANGEYLAKVIKASDEPSYRGCAPIKEVAARMVSEV